MSTRLEVMRAKAQETIATGPQCPHARDVLALLAVVDAAKTHFASIDIANGCDCSRCVLLRALATLNQAEPSAPREREQEQP